MPRHTKHGMRTTLTLDDDSELPIYVGFTYWPGMAGTYYDPPEADSADWTEVEVEQSGRQSRPLTDDEQAAFEAWWETDGQHLACERVGEECGA